MTRTKNMLILRQVQTNFAGKHQKAHLLKYIKLYFLASSFGPNGLTGQHVQ